MRMLLGVLVLILAAGAFSADELLTVKGERLTGDLSGGGGAWKLGANTLRAADVLVIRFSPEPPPARMPSGVFIRGGSLIAGTLTSIIGDEAELSSSAFGPLKLKRDDVAGAFSPLPAGQAENMPELARYAAILAATLGTPGSGIAPGKRCRIRFAGLDEVTGERVMRVGSDQILLATRTKGVETISRQFVRLLEINVPGAPPPSPDDGKLGPEMIVRLKSGDLLRGRVVKLDGKALTLRHAALGERQIERGMLAAAFLSGRDSGVTWLSSQTPARSVHTPIFDSEFPARMDASSDGGDIIIKGVPCERGIGVHSKSELQFTLPGTPQRFVSVAGIDAETKGRGAVVARVLADGRELWKSGVVTGKDAAQIVALDLGTAKSLTLEVDFGPDEDDSGDHFDWGWAAVIGK